MMVPYHHLMQSHGKHNQKTASYIEGRSTQLMLYSEKMLEKIGKAIKSTNFIGENIKNVTCHKGIASKQVYFQFVR
ncbi:hypothetical protein FGO68_gene9982 [Halteria grandinella]|uniref:Uncharacterized protein n=1 Tax=Halteria grandinella TaxID=5974 RepID=A0A8J8NKL0_HALGN|nr:hypothetical protein FGO68_gene9982 [Halteria grandinella]